MSVTMRDIARMVGVSVSTVSRSLNDNPRISAETRDRVKEVAAELDFDFNANARSLSTHRSGTVALVVPDSIEHFDNSLYINLLIHNLQRNLATLGLDCIVTEAATPSGANTLRRLILQHKIDGALLLLAGTMPEDWALIRKRAIPVVQVHYAPYYFDASRLDYFFTDNALGGRLAGDALLDTGCRHIAYLADPSPNSEMADREKGVKEAQEKRGIVPDDTLRFEVKNNFSAAYTCIRDNIEAFRRADGLFAPTDVMALAALRAFADEGVQVPRDIRVVGYDDIEIANWVRPTLTTIHQPREEIARLATDRLCALLKGEGKGLEQRMIPPNLVRRESC
ncbi:MAG TPA: LacI family DNA-binding transcriptional regulator [Spirochaetales bacterium]|nr:LacI family DNA-binding transcriptional regulator [Spirochaetales bacterium]